MLGHAVSSSTTCLHNYITQKNKDLGNRLHINTLFPMISVAITLNRGYAGSPLVSVSEHMEQDFSQVSYFA